MRLVFQDTVLPNLAYIGGGGELVPLAGTAKPV